jgi:hypothetical protein
MLPVNYTFTPADAGIHTFKVTLKTAGNDSITVMDSASSSIVGSASVVAAPAAAHSFALTGYASTTYAGSSHNLNLEVLDAYGNLATGYTGTVHFTSTDIRAKLPADYTFTATDAGAHVFNATLNLVGKRSLTARDKVTTSLVGTQSGIVVTNTYTLFDSSNPPNPSSSDSSSVEVGVRFYADVSGTITGLRFYRGIQNFGPHVAHIWTSSGKLLAAATFSSESTSGWQRVTFSKPVTITAGVTYIASYHTNVGHYASSADFFDSQFDSGPLHAPAGNNGIYAYGPSGSFPTQSFQNTNYYVDVLFTPAGPAVKSVTPANGTTNVGLAASIVLTFNGPLNPASVNASTVRLYDNAGKLVAATVAYDPATWKVTLTPTNPLAPMKRYKVYVLGGSKGIYSMFGQVLPASFVSAFTTGLI